MLVHQELFNLIAKRLARSEADAVDKTDSGKLSFPALASPSLGSQECQLALVCSNKAAFMIVRYRHELKPHCPILENTISFFSFSKPLEIHCQF